MLRNTKQSYGLAAILLHWLIGLLIIGQIGLGLTMLRLDDQRRAFELIQLHKSIGFLILGLVAIRICWRLANKRPELPEATTRLERIAAGLSHHALYLLMIVLPLTGWALVSVSPLKIPTLVFSRFRVPNLPVSASEASELFWSSAHAVLGFAAAGLIALHILAALWHHFIRRDQILVRMLRPDGNTASPAGVDKDR